MLKAVVAATAAVTIAGSTFAFAQPQDRSAGSRRWQPTTEDIRAFQAARLVGLRAGLALHADQEKHWPAFEQAMRELQQLRLNHVTAIRDARREGRPAVTDPAERMRQRADRLAESGAVLKRLADATEPLYNSLDEAQRRRFAILTRTEGSRGWQRRGREDGERGMPRGHHRTDTAPGEVTPQVGQGLTRNTVEGEEAAGLVFTRKIADGNVFAQTFVSKTVDGVMVGRVFGTKTVDGELTVAEGPLFTGKALFGGKPAGEKPRTFSRKIIIGEPPVFGRKAVSSI